jgi:hypothetical protein
MTKDLKRYFTKKELEFMFDTIGDNFSSVYDKGTKKEKLTNSILDKLSDIAFKNNYNK